MPGCVILKMYRLGQTDYSDSFLGAECCLLNQFERLWPDLLATTHVDLLRPALQPLFKSQNDIVLIFLRTSREEFGQHRAG